VYVTLTGGGEVFYEAATVLAVFVLLGHWFEMRARGVFPTTKEQRCWWHKSGNTLAALPKSAQPAARAALAEIYNAEDTAHARAAAKTFAAEFGVKWPKAAAKITDDLDVLLTFYDYPAEHWIHLRTTNPIESTFATVRLRTRVTKGPGSRAAGVAMAFKLIEAPDPVADGQRTPPGRTRPRRSPLRQRQTRRATQRPRSTRRSSSGVRHANPQVLTIAQRRANAGSVGDSRRSPRQAKFS
jgi:hypothetical protein